MNRGLLISIFYICCCLLSACGQTNSNNKKEEVTVHKETPAPIQKGQLNHIQCSGDPTISYQLYIPANLQDNKPAPLMVWFDPHKAAQIPLEKYKSIADQSGCIFIASENSENGLTSDSYEYFGNTMLQDVRSKLKVDSNRIYAAGFSGGGRVALLLASNHPEIKGVIMNSAGTSTVPPTLKSIYFLGGASDFNLREIYAGMKELYLKLPSGMLVFEGKHEWAPEKEMSKALQFILNPTSMYIQSEQNAFNKLKSKLDPSFTLENKYQQQLLSLLNQHQDTMFWKQQMAQLKKDPALNGKDQQAIRERLNGFLSIYAWSACNQMLRNKQQEGLALYTDLYHTVDPLNPEWAFMKAILYARSGDATLASQFLKIAKSLGFSEFNRMKQDPDLNKVLGPAELSGK